MLIRVGLAVFWVLHFLPLVLLAPLGRALGALLYFVAGERRKVVLTNLKLSFPDQSDRERRRLARRHFQVLGRSLVEHSLLWWSGKQRLQSLVRIEGLEHWQAVADRDRKSVV